MKYSKRNAKREVYSDKCLYEEKIKISNNLNLQHKELEEKNAIIYQKERNNKDQSRNKEQKNNGKDQCN